jgi:hypothetical protein
MGFLRHFRINCLLIFLCGAMSATGVAAEDNSYALTVYGAKMTSNNWHEFFKNPNNLDFIDSKLLVVALSKRLGGYKKLLSYEVEGQLGKHDGIQQHWEINGLGTLRWEPFWWDNWLDTSAAFGMGVSFATEKPQAEVLNEGDSEQWMLYWMIELELSLPQQPDYSFVTRIHHRSEAYGLAAEAGGSNALAIGLKYKF